ncbi:hypothetical protein LSAT2_033085 [Lamellibrachia satsuma]|nr:hypothetical protein LSAT2_033085 [Lamellibrachia satsuma]
MLVVAAHSGWTADLKLSSQLPVKLLDLGCWFNSCVGTQEYNTTIVKPLCCTQLNTIDRGRLETSCASTLSLHRLVCGKGATWQSVRSHRSQTDDSPLVQCRLEPHACEPVGTIYFVPYTPRGITASRRNTMLPDALMSGSPGQGSNFPV